jgi:hemerythrin-like metal-binding protein
MLLELVVWSEDLNVGIPVIDAQHKKLIEIMNGLHEGTSRGDGMRRIGKVLEELDRYAAVHLSFEEGMMLKMGYPAFEVHVKQHDFLRSRIVELRGGYARGEVDALDLVKFLIHWFMGHIREADRKFGAFLRQREDFPAAAG